MSDVMFGLLAETFLHPGSGQSDGAIDLKVAREAVTGYPYIPGSAVKGALCAAMCDGGEQKTRVDAAFGQVDGAGSVLVCVELWVECQELDAADPISLPLL